MYFLFDSDVLFSQGYASNLSCRFKKYTYNLAQNRSAELTYNILKFVLL